MNKLNYIFDVAGEKGRPMRGFLDTQTKEIVIYDDSRGKELFRIGGNSQFVKPETKKKLTDLTFVITNGSDKRETATLFASNLEPLIQPLGISVVIKEIENQVFNTHNYLRRDILSNKLKVVGFQYLVQNTQQFHNKLQFGSIKPYGNVVMTPYAPLNFISEYQIAQNMFSRKVNWDVDARSILYIPIEPKSSVTLVFTVLEDSNEPLISEYKNIKVESSTINESPIQSNFDGDNNNNNNFIIGVIKLGIVAIGFALIIKAISKL